MVFAVSCHFHFGSCSFVRLRSNQTNKMPLFELELQFSISLDQLIENPYGHVQTKIST